MEHNKQNKLESSNISKDSAKDSNATNTPRSKKVQKIINSAYDLSLGISIVVAILIGVGLGFLMLRLSGVVWLFWLGVIWGVAAALLNIYKAYRRMKKDLDSMANNEKYAYMKQKEGEN